MISLAASIPTATSNSRYRLTNPISPAPSSLFTKYIIVDLLAAPRPPRISLCKSTSGFAMNVAISLPSGTEGNTLYLSSYDSPFTIPKKNVINADKLCPLVSVDFLV